MARLRIGLTQTEVANILQIQHSTISRIEKHGVIHWTLFKLLQLTSLYQISLFDLFVGGKHVINTAVSCGGTIVLIGGLIEYQRYLQAELPGVNILFFPTNAKASKYLQDNAVRLVIDNHSRIKADLDMLERLHSSKNNRHTLSIVITKKENVETIKKVQQHNNAIFFDENKSSASLTMLVTDILRVA